MTWCHHMVVCAKKNGEHQERTVDFQALNDHIQFLFHQVCSVLHNVKKMVTDAWNGYHSVSQKKTSTSRPSSPHEVSIGIAQHHKATFHLEMATKDDSH